MKATRVTALVAGLAMVLSATMVPTAQAANRTEQTQAAVPAGSLFVPMAPRRILDTRSNRPISENGIFLSVGEHMPVEATAVVFNLTGTNATTSTYVRATPGDTPPDFRVSNLNLAVGETRANLVTVALGYVGSDSRGFELAAGAGTVDLIVDLAGYYVTGVGAKYTPLPPQRVLDTRAAPGIPVAADSAITVNLAGRVPATATSAVLNLTGTQPTESTYVTAFPHGEHRPGASNLNLVAGQTVPNLVTVKLGEGQTVDLYNHRGSTHLVADLAGFYAPDAQNAFFPLIPERVLDTRAWSVGAVGPGAMKTLPLHHWMPASARAVVMNLTGTNSTADTFVTASPTGAARPLASNLNLRRGQTAPNLVIVALGGGGGIDLYNNAGDVDLVGDFAGYFAPHSPACVTECLLGWGSNDHGKVGDGGTNLLDQRLRYNAGLSGVSSVAGTPYYAYALKNDGTVWAWGYSTYGDLDGVAHQATMQGVGGLATYEPAPVPVPGLSGVVEVAAGYAVKSDGTLWAWGRNENWRLGTGNTNFGPATPARVAGLTNVKHVAGSRDNGYALTGDGAVWAWGANGRGQLGNGADPGTNPCYYANSGAKCGSAVPVKVSGLTGVVAIGARRGGGMAVKSDGSVWTWGWNGTEGELGTGTPCTPVAQPNQLPMMGQGCESHVPVQAPGLTDVKSVAGHDNGVYVVKSDGTVWAWGYGRYGELGNGSFCRVDSADPAPCTARTPAQVSIEGVVEVVSHLYTTYARKSDGTVWAWGESNRQFHNPLGYAYVTTPIQISGLAGASSISVSGHAVVATP